MDAQNPFANERFMGAVSYFGILCLVPLLAGRKSAFTRYHAKQGFLLFAIESAVGWIPLVGWLIMLACVVASVAGALAALQGREWEVPVIGRYAKQLQL